MMNAADYLLEKSHGLDKDFIVGTKETVSYQDLYKKVNILAAYIYKTIGTDKEIMLLSQNSVFFIVSYLSIIKSGNTVMLLEAGISESDLKAVVNNCSLSGIFIQSKFASKLDNLGLHTKVFTESVLSDLPAKSKKEIKVESKNEDVALVMFTSGSTGKKKGVMLTHKNIKANTESIITYQKLTRRDRIEVVLPFFYSYGLSLLHTHLRAGASMVLNQSIFLGSAINEIKQYECTGLAGVPSTYQILISKADFLKQDFKSIRYFTQAGGKLANKFITSITKIFPGKQFFVMYGATEATARLSYLPPKLVGKKLGSVGKGIPQVTLKVIDGKGKSVLPGQIGEIVAIGDNIMKGYYKDPKGTREVLKNGKFYTKDLATVDQDGFIYVVGRASNMIKSAGYKVFPGEIEQVINSVTDVLDCVVFGLPDDIMGEAVVASVLTKKPSKKLKADIISSCNKALASYKVPKHVVFFDEFPLNSSHKKDMLKIKEIVISKIKT